MKVDLHVHSSASDGVLSPKELVDYATKRGVKIFALTDHDNVDGIKEAINYAAGKNIEIVNGIEFSTNPEGLTKEIHIIGLFVDINNKKFKNAIKQQKKYRIIHLKKLLKKLKKFGYDVSFEEGVKEAGKNHFGRPTIAKILIKKYPEFKDTEQVFNELLGKTGKVFIESESLNMKAVISVIHAAGGLAILAHPGYLINPEKVIKVFIENKGDGIEVDCPYDGLGSEAEQIRAKFREIAIKNNLIISGGTDFHEKKENLGLGDCGVSEQEFNKLKEKANSI